MIYADTSALVKLVVAEAESTALTGWLQPRDEPVISSTLCRVELIQTCRRLTTNAPDPATTAILSVAERLLQTVDMIPLGEDIVDVAARLSMPGLRSLAALHLATALTIERELTAFLAYDLRLLSAAQSVSLPVASPGRW